MNQWWQIKIRNLLIALIMFGMVAPTAVYAIAGVGDIVSVPILEATTIQENIWDQVWRVTKNILLNAAVVGVVNVGQQVARDAADSISTWIVKGDWGSNPLAYTKSPLEYAQDLGKQEFGEFLGTLSKELGFGTLLCAPSLLVYAIPAGIMSSIAPADFSNFPKGISLSLMKEQQLRQVQPSCSFNDIVADVESLSNTYKSTSEFMGKYSTIFDAGNNEIDTVAISQFKSLIAVETANEKAKYERNAPKSFKDVRSPISGQIVQPSDTVAYEANANTVRAQREFENQMLVGMLGSGAEAIPGIFASTLVNSLSRKLIDRLRQGRGMIPDEKEKNLASIFGAGKNADNTSGGVGQFMGVKTAVINGGDYDLLTNFSACPQKFIQPDNCVIDNGFSSAIRTAGAGLTVREALDQGKLNADWELVPPSDAARNEDRLCYKDAYCYSNLVKLRKARIIPIGWEIAATVVQENGKTTLGEAVSRFNDCAYRCSNDESKACATSDDCTNSAECLPNRDKNHPYCHLIDPDWVLKMPENICRALAFGSVPESDFSPTRKEECVDQPSCLQEDNSGNCVGGYGYCLREKNTWRFAGDICPAQFAGCRTFQNKEFGAVSVLESTIDTGYCTDKNSGCLGYYTDYTAQGQFDKTAAKIYLNSNAAVCEAKYAGCSEVIDPDTSATQFIKVPPPGLNCKGTSEDSPECANYAHACTVDEVGCNLYNPANQDPTVPGIATFAARDASGNVVNWNDECPSECAGYASYYQAPTQTELTMAPVAFIPSTAKQCSAVDVGCAEYVNSDVPAKGGGSNSYFSHIQKCAQPDDASSPHKVFYSWEGSDQTGYQLHQHDLVVDLQGKPIYDAATSKQPELNAACTADIYKTRLIDGKPNPVFDPDCRELFNQAGTPFYRLLSYTLPSSPDCTLYRFAGSTATNCSESGGQFDKVSGSCQYGILPTLSQSCKQEFVGCRAFNGAEANNAVNILPAGGGVDSFATVDDWTGGELSSEGISVGDSVLKVTAGAAEHPLALNKDKTYRVIFWAKGQGELFVKIKSAVGSNVSVDLNSAAIKLTPEWNRYELASSPLAAAEPAGAVRFEKGGAAGALLYLDNVVVQEQADALNLVRGSWNTPTSCDATPDDSTPGAALNCKEYTVTTNSTPTKVYLTGFTSLCREASAGCQRFVNTFNSAQLNEREINISKNDPAKTKIVPADDFVYLAANSASACPQDKRGCSALGVDNGTGGTDTTYRINNPDDYERTACFQEEEYCGTFGLSDGQTRYFKYPKSNQRCEYRENVDKGGSSFSGWFEQGTDKPCYEDFVAGGSNYGLYHNADKGYAGKLALCPAEQNQCTAFIDHADISPEFPNGQAYYLIKNNKIDLASCNGKVSPKEGCVLLEDTSKGQRDFSTLASYCKSDPNSNAACATILKNAGVGLGDTKKDGVAVDPVSAKIFVKTPAASSYDCNAAATNGLFGQTSCEGQFEKLQPLLSDQNFCLTDNGGAPLCTSLNPAAYCKTESGKVMVPTLFNMILAQCTAYADSNTIVKVQRDRTCGEWLTCRSAMSVWDKTTQKYKMVCADLGVCSKYDVQADNIGKCGRWEDPADAKRVPLSTVQYVRRNVGWYGREYSGYSLWNKFQADRFGFFAGTSGTDFKETKVYLGVPFNSVVAKDGKQCDKTPDGSVCYAADFIKNGVIDPDLIKEFGPEDQTSYAGVCYNRKCWYPIDGFSKVPPKKEDFATQACRGYPENDAPYPTSVVESWANDFKTDPLQKSAGFKNVNVCQAWSSVYENGLKNYIDFDAFKNDSTWLSTNTSASQNCDCSYKKVKYGNSANYRYFALQQKAPKGLCDGGWLVDGPKTAENAKTISKVGVTCSSDRDCIDERVMLTKMSDVAGTPKWQEFPGSEDGKCQFQKTVTEALGWSGYCLEQDLSTHINNSTVDRACLTWLPTDIVGGFDLYNQYTSAGYRAAMAAAGGVNYCTQSTGYLDASGSAGLVIKDVNPLFEDVNSLNYNRTCFSAANSNLPNYNQPKGFAASFDWSTADNAAEKYCSEYNTGHTALYFQGSGFGGTTSDDIDHVDIKFTKANPFFPIGYTLRVVDDGKIRLFQTQAFFNKNKNNSSFNSTTGAPDNGLPLAFPFYQHNVYNSDGDTGWALYDRANAKPGAYAVGFGGGVDNSILLTKLSYEARCPRPKNPLISADIATLCQGGSYFDAYSESVSEKILSNICLSSYFECNHSDANKKSFSGDPKEVETNGSEAITGVVRSSYHYKNANVSLLSNAVDIENGSYGEIWYARVDNHDHTKNQSGAGSNFLMYGLTSNVWTGGIFNKLSGNVNSGNCNLTDEDQEKGFEVRLNFSGTARYLKSITAASCDSSDNQIPSFVDVSIVRRNRCTEVVGVTSDPVGGGDNKAFTNRVWQAPNGGSKDDSEQKFEVVPKPGGKQSVVYSTTEKPFGSFSQQDQPTQYSGVWFTNATGTSYLGKSVQYDINSGAWPDFVSPVFGSSYGCASGNCIMENPKLAAEGGVDWGQARSALMDNLFAKIYFLYQDSTQGQFSPEVSFLNNPKNGAQKEPTKAGSSYWGYNLSNMTDFALQNFDKSDSAAAKAAYPRVYAFDPGNCTKPGSCRLTRRMGMTVNGKSEAGAVLFGKGSFTATTEFYGWADENHMPLRKVTVDWDDSSPPSGGTDGKYRNHKPTCTLNANPARVCVDSGGKRLMNYTCQDSADCVDEQGKSFGTCQKEGDRLSFGSWGGSGTKEDEGACEEGFFQFVHTYTYSKSCGHSITPSEIQQYGLKNKVGVGENVCIFTPRVQLVDNWGICAGVDAGGKVVGYSDKTADCSQDKKIHFVPYQGSIIVKE